MSSRVVTLDDALKAPPAKVVNLGAWPRGLSAKHREQLEAGSGISAEVAAERQYSTTNDKALLKKLGIAPPEHGDTLLIPLHDVHGKVVADIGRHDEPRLDLTKLARTVSPRSSSTRIRIVSRCGSTFRLDVGQRSATPISRWRSPKVRRKATRACRTLSRTGSASLRCSASHVGGVKTRTGSQRRWKTGTR